MGLKFFQGNRKGTIDARKNVISDEGDGYQQFSPPPSGLFVATPSNNTAIPVAEPVAYVPPNPQQQQLTPYSSSSPSTIRQNKDRNTMIISNPELDHNLRLLQRVTFGGRTLLHKCFILLSILTGLTALNNIVAHTLAVFFYGHYEDPMEVLLRWFTVGLYFLVILIETNHSTLVQQSMVFQHWASRGVFYTFLGVLGVVEYDVGQQNYGGSYRDRYNQYTYGRNNRIVIYFPTGQDAFELYIWCTSWCMLLVGLIYILLGALCMHQKYQQVQAQFEQRQRMAATGQQQY
jgi:hypothetical protein